MPKTIKCEVKYCRRPGWGIPPRCELHTEEEEENTRAQKVIDAVIENPSIQKTIDKVDSILDLVKDVIGKVVSGEFPSKKPEKRTEPTQMARIILQFGPKDPLTEEIIKTRRKELAILAHPDKQGGSEDAMKRINKAAEILLNSIK